LAQPRGGVDGHPQSRRTGFSSKGRAFMGAEFRQSCDCPESKSQALSGDVFSSQAAGRMASSESTVFEDGMLRRRRFNDCAYAGNVAVIIALFRIMNTLNLE
jgi:hypothetical protein